jgi:hypothetical protein
MSEEQKAYKQYIENIKSSGLTIYDEIEIGDEELWIPAEVLEKILNNSFFIGNKVDSANRTRSKEVKEFVSESLGYPVPSSFKKTQPRFPGQNFDTYVQKSNNLQIWNEEIAPSRRYVIVQVSDNNEILGVKVIRGEDLAEFDSTGKLTQKYQARLNIGSNRVSDYPNESYLTDTHNLKQLITNSQKELEDPTSYPKRKNLLSINELYSKISKLEGTQLDYLGLDQERNRGAELHKKICSLLGYKYYNDDGTFPDITNQLLEVKLQTSPTIDLGLVSPNDKTPLDIPEIEDTQIRHCDIRYAVIYGNKNGDKITIQSVYLSSGQNFYNLFPQMEGKKVNKKIQLRLPSDFFQSTSNTSQTKLFN